MKQHDLTGIKFGKLLVIGQSSQKGYWRVHCDCGTEKSVRGSSLNSGNTKSCGCLVRHNPGRPKQPNYSPHIPFNSFVAETFEHMTPLRNALARQGVIITSKGELRYGGRTEHYATPYHALAAAIEKTIKVPDLESDKS